jgi:hypothetical protein
MVAGQVHCSWQALLAACMRPLCTGNAVREQLHVCLQGLPSFKDPYAAPVGHSPAGMASRDPYGVDAPAGYVSSPRGSDYSSQQGQASRGGPHFSQCDYPGLAELKPYGGAPSAQGGTYIAGRTPAQGDAYVGPPAPAIPPAGQKDPTYVPGQQAGSFHASQPAGAQNAGQRGLHEGALQHMPHASWPRKQSLGFVSKQARTRLMDM